MKARLSGSARVTLIHSPLRFENIVKPVSETVKR